MRNSSFPVGPVTWPYARDRNASGRASITCSRIHAWKRLAIARDRVPREVERVVAIVVAVRVRRMRASRHDARSRRPPTTAGSPRCVPTPSNRPRPPRRSRAMRRAASTASFCTPMIPSTSTLPARSAFCACTIATSGRSAGTHASVSPVNGHATNLMLGLTVARSDPRSRERTRTACRWRRQRRHWPSPRGCAPRSPADAATPAPPRRAADAASRRRDCRPTRTPACGAQPASDHLVVQQVGRHADQRQIADPLSDDFVPGGERDQMREPFERHAIALVHHPGHRLAELEKFRHRVPSTGGACSPKRRTALSFRISGRTSSRMAVFSRSASHRSGAIHG